MKKNLLPAYEPARLVKGSDRWYIVWYCTNDLTGQYERFRRTFRLNRIFNLTERARRAGQLVERINYWLDQGLPISQFQEEKVVLALQQPIESELMKTNIVEAIELARDVKCQSDRTDSRKTYRSICNLITAFLTEKNWHRLAVGEFRKHHAIAYMDHCLVDRKVGARTYNNNLMILHAFFEVLADRNYVLENPWKDIKRMARRKIKKRRRNFSPAEARAVARRIQQDDELLFLALLMEYSCFMRPKEIRLARRQDVDLERGLIDIPDQTSKNWQARVVTIPDAFLPYFRTELLLRTPPMHYLFGRGWRPHPTATCGKNTMYDKHRRILLAMHEEGSLPNIQGLTWYSWKDTGITDAMEYLPVPAVQDQAGHHSPEMTEIYRHRRKVNEPMKGMKNRVI